MAVVTIVGRRAVVVNTGRVVKVVSAAGRVDTTGGKNVEVFAVEERISLVVIAAGRVVVISAVEVALGVLITSGRAITSAG